jgi:hypothetical protein
MGKVSGDRFAPVLLAETGEEATEGDGLATTFLLAGTGFVADSLAHPARLNNSAIAMLEPIALKNILIKTVPLKLSEACE